MLAPAATSRKRTAVVPAPVAKPTCDACWTVDAATVHEHGAASARVREMQLHQAGFTQDGTGWLRRCATCAATTPNISALLNREWPRSRKLMTKTIAAIAALLATSACGTLSAAASLHPEVAAPIAAATAYAPCADIIGKPAIESTAPAAQPLTFMEWAALAIETTTCVMTTAEQLRAQGQRESVQLPYVMATKIASSPSARSCDGEGR